MNLLHFKVTVILLGVLLLTRSILAAQCKNNNDYILSYNSGNEMIPFKEVYNKTEAQCTKALSMHLNSTKSFHPEECTLFSVIGGRLMLTIPLCESKKSLQPTGPGNSLLCSLAPNHRTYIAQFLLPKANL